MNAQQLKNSILQEAIEGRLVPQDPNDEPASVLLDKIRKEKARLVKEGKLKKKDLEEIPISEDEVPFEIPNSWEWVKLGTICELISGKSYTEADTGAFYVKVSDMNLTENEKEIKTSSHFCICKDTDYIPNNSIIFPKRGGAILTGKKRMVKSSHICIDLNTMAIHPYYEVIYPFLYIWFGNVDLGRLFDGSAVPQINNKDIAPLLFPLPPLTEQHRIVAKIEELLPKVEEYGKAQESLDKLNEEMPERLKKSILQDAIEGRLVPQDPNDEPASALLDKIRKEKARLVKEGKLKKKDLVETPIEEDEIPFKIPDSWEWVKLSTLIKMISGTSYSKNDIRKEGVRILRGGNIQNNELHIYDDDVFVPFELHDSEKNIAKNDIIIVASTGSKAVIGKPAFIRKTYDNIQIGAFLRIIRPYLDLYASYIEIIFSSEYYRKHIRDKVKGININNIKSEYIEDLLIPLPPLPEQHRIVSKIEQLMNEIDKLKI